VDARPSSRWASVAVTVAVAVVVASPAIRDRDSFPLSTYPIYAHARGRIATFDTAIGVDESGLVERLSLQTIARTDDPLIASSFVADAVRAGDADELCGEIASRAGSGVVRIEVVSERHDTIEWLRGEDSLRDRTVHATCEVPG
jgi:hypothetical protein